MYTETLWVAEGAMIQIKKSSWDRFFLYWSTVAIRTLGCKCRYLEKKIVLAKKELIMGTNPAGSRTSNNIVNSDSYTFSQSPSLLCFLLCWLHSQARHSSHCVGKVVITNSRLHSTRLVTSRKEIVFSSVVSEKSWEWYWLAWLSRCPSLHQSPVRFCFT